MKRKSDILEVAIKIFALYAFVQTLYTVVVLIGQQSLYFDADDFGWLGALLVQVAVGLTIIAITFILIMRAGKIALFFTAEDGPIDVPIPDRITIFEIVFLLLGSFLIIDGIPSLLRWVVSYLNQEVRPEEREMFYRLDSYDSLYIFLPKLVGGILLVLNTRYLSKWLEDRSNRFDELNNP